MQPKIRYMSAAVLLALCSSLSAKESAVIVFDGSGSMWGEVDGKPKIEIAREVMGTLLKDWNPDIDLGVMVYGHREKGDCADIELVAPVGKPDVGKVTAAINDITPKGKTPIGASLQKAADALRFTEDPATVILISDGEESCEADPCTVAKELKSKGINFTAHVVGFDIQGNSKALEQLKCVADSTGGKFFEAKDAAGLQTALAETAKAVAAKPEPPPAPTSNMKMVTVEPHGIDDPLPTELGIIYKLTLKADESSYFKLAKPIKDVKFILDSQHAEKNDRGNIFGKLSITDQDGVIIKDEVIKFWDNGIGYRRKALFSSEQTTDFGFKITNGQYSYNYYLTVLNPDDTPTVPIFGEIIPGSMEVGSSISGHLGVGDETYHAIHLAKGNYKILLDFATSNHKNDNIRGHLTLLDGDGAGGNSERGPEPLISFNEIDSFSRKSAVFPIEEEGTYVVKLRNISFGGDYTYNLKITQSQ